MQLRNHRLEFRVEVEQFWVLLKLIDVASSPRASRGFRVVRPFQCAVQFGSLDRQCSTCTTSVDYKKANLLLSYSGHHIHHRLHIKTPPSHMINYIFTIGLSEYRRHTRGRLLMSFLRTSQAGSVL
jgi:hypothetical protein